MRFLFILSLSLLAFGCSKENKPCPDDDNCGDGLKCIRFSEDISSCKKSCAKPKDCGEGRTCTKNGICQTIDELKCSFKCFETGKCSWGHSFGYSRCRAIKDEDCAKSYNCKKYGNCALTRKDSKCEPAKNEHCAESDLCKENGACSLGWLSHQPECKPSKDDHCAESARCKDHGMCSIYDGKCIKK
jgi:hypothetical protein